MVGTSRGPAVAAIMRRETEIEILRENVTWRLRTIEEAMPNKKLPDDFDWIDARQRCTGKATFNTLRQAVLRDVEKMNEPGRRYDVNDKPDEDYLAVWRLISDAEAHKYFLVTFERTGNHIEISFEHPALQHPDKPILVSVRVSKETGECVYIVNDSEVQTWELCQMALEALFFRWPTA